LFWDNLSEPVLGLIEDLLFAVAAIVLLAVYLFPMILYILTAAAAAAAVGFCVFSWPVFLELFQVNVVNC